MTRAGQRESVLRVVAPIVVGVIGIGLWQLTVTVGGVDDYLLPSPASIAREFNEFAPDIIAAAMTTGSNALFGLVIGAIAGILLAIFASWSAIVDRMSAPVIAALAVVPIVALAPVLNSMYGADSEFGRRAIAALAAFVPVFINALRGLRQTLPVHRELMHVLGASHVQALRTVTLPSAAPFVLTGIRIASSLAVISALVAEYFGGPRGGLGSIISSTAASSAYARSWAYVAASIALGLLFYLVTALLERLSNRTPAGVS